MCTSTPLQNPDAEVDNVSICLGLEERKKQRVVLRTSISNLQFGGT